MSVFKLKIDKIAEIRFLKLTSSMERKLNEVNAYLINQNKEQKWDFETWDVLLFVRWTPGWLLFHAVVTYRWSIKEITVCENTTAIRIIAQSYKVTAEHLLCSLKCIMAMSSSEAFKWRVLIKLVRGRDEKWMTALGLRSGLMTLSPLLAELTVSGLSPAFCHHRSQ